MVVHSKKLNNMTQIPITPATAAIVTVLILIIWYTGWRMHKRLSDEVIGWRERDIRSLQERCNALEKWSDTLYNHQDMKDSWHSAYIRGIRNNTYTPKQITEEFEDWIKDKYKSIDQIQAEMKVKSQHQQVME